MPVHGLGSTSPIAHQHGSGAIPPLRPQLSTQSTLSSLAKPVSFYQRAVNTLHYLWMQLVARTCLRSYFCGSISAHTDTTGFLGQDKEYNFQENLQLAGGKPFVLEPNDFYIEVRADRKGFDPQYLILPASLFRQGAITVDTIYFSLKGQSYFLKLSPHVKSGVSLHEVIHQHQTKLEKKPHCFLYEADAPSDHHHWAYSFLSPSAYELGFSGIAALDRGSLPKLSRGPPILKCDVIITADKITVRAEAPGEVSFRIVVDKPNCYIHVNRELPANPFVSTVVPDTFCHIDFSEIPDVDPNFEGATMSIANGLLSIVIPYTSTTLPPG